MIAAIAHDAGGAEVVSSWLKHASERFSLTAEGPANLIFDSKFESLNRLELKLAIENCDWVLCGTSWDSTLELEGIKLARQLGKKSVAFLDHWSNYLDRFSDQGSLCLPNEIWVGDNYAYDILNKCLPEIEKKIVKNFYLEDLKSKVQSFSKLGDTNTINLLYVCEPIAEHAKKAYGNENHWGYTETDAISYFFEHVGKIYNRIDSIVIRPHPSESRSKYDWIKSNADYSVNIGGEKSLIEEIADSTAVFGCESMAMVVGLISNKIVYSVIPPSGKICVLPQKEIIHFRDIFK
ncbi:MAG: hypothetical protein KGM99_00945 [Burkholderiales bacterium]|nr:hypothetical protein [Burkholderiales bacterium]